jgi:hypothetical protein
VIGERMPETVAEVVGERGGNELEGVGGVAGEERAGKKGSKETADVVVVGGECGEIGELGIEKGPSKEEPPIAVGMMRGESLGRLNVGRSAPGSCLSCLTKRLRRARKWI